MTQSNLTNIETTKSQAEGSPMSKASPRFSYKTIQNFQRGLLLLPGVLLYGIFNFIPLVGMLPTSLLDWPGIGPKTFVGLENFKKILGVEYYRDQLLNALAQNVVFFIVIIGAFLIIGTCIALLLSFRTWGRKYYQVI